MKWRGERKWEWEMPSNRGELQFYLGCTCVWPRFSLPSIGPVPCTGTWARAAGGTATPHGRALPPWWPCCHNLRRYGRGCLPSTYLMDPTQLRVAGDNGPPRRAHPIDYTTWVPVVGHASRPIGRQFPVSVHFHRWSRRGQWKGKQEHRPDPRCCSGPRNRTPAGSQDMDQLSRNLPPPSGHGWMAQHHDVSSLTQVAQFY